ncbi:UNVERIFIED_CONTAM: hypothetical protein RMT77_017655 [Armadillidium vulgare]
MIYDAVLEFPASFFVSSDKKRSLHQKFKETTSDDLHFSITELGCTSALRCLKTHRNWAPSALDIPRSNMIAERAVKLMEELSEICKIDKYLHIRFVATNNFKLQISV